MPRTSEKLEKLSPLIRDEAILLNGRLKFYARLRNFREVSRGRYEVTRHGDRYTIEGGRHLGGTPRDWFVEKPGEWDRPIHCTSVADALDMLNNM